MPLALRRDDRVALRAARRATRYVFRVEGTPRRRYRRISATPMDTRCHPGPPRPTPACPRTRGAGVCRAWSIAVAFVVALSTTAAATELERRIDESIALCTAADDVAPARQAEILARGLVLADAAVALDERSADAHFAVVCNLGKATRFASAGFGAMKAVYRLRREIDLTLALAPQHAEATAAKGALLFELPRWLGGDRREAEVWLRRALVLDPRNTTARGYLAEFGDTTAPPVLAPATDTSLTR